MDRFVGSFCKTDTSDGLKLGKTARARVGSDGKPHRARFRGTKYSEGSEMKAQAADNNSEVTSQK